MKLRQLSYFVAVADEGGFTRAAARVSVAQPAVSAQIRRLERELGEALFHRDQRSVTLTAAGEALLPHARAALAAAERGRDTIASLHGLLHGRLRVGVSSPVDHRLADALGEFHRAHPAIEIGLTEQHNEPLLRAVADGDLDAAIVGMPAGQAVSARVRTRMIAAEPLVVAVPRGHALAGRAGVAIGRLREQPMITLTHNSGLRVVLERACRDAGFTPRIAAETSELGSLVDLVAAGLGVALLPRSAAAGAGVAVLRLTRPCLQRRTALAWNDVAASPAGRAFVAVAMRRFAGGSVGHPRPGPARRCPRAR
jgi:DNA-binding transcriptional LysR family regulator